MTIEEFIYQSDCDHEPMVIEVKAFSIGTFQESHCIFCHEPIWKQIQQERWKLSKTSPFIDVSNLKIRKPISIPWEDQ